MWGLLDLRVRDVRAYGASVPGEGGGFEGHCGWRIDRGKRVVLCSIGGEVEKGLYAGKIEAIANWGDKRWALSG